MQTMCKYLKVILKPVIVVFLSILISATIIVGGWNLFLYGLDSHWFDTPVSDKNLIKSLEYYSKKELLSCKVLKKKMKEQHYTIAVYETDSVDFVTFHNEFIKNDTSFVALSNNDFMIETKELIAKSLRKTKKNRSSTDILIYKNDNGYFVRKIGLLSPDIIILEVVNKW